MKYAICNIKPHHAGFGMWECEDYAEAWNDLDDLLQAVADNTGLPLDLDAWDKSPAEMKIDCTKFMEPGEFDEIEIEDIRGKIYNQPNKVYGVFINPTTPIQYFGVKFVDE